jgi:Periplasmic copper-binding protein (NosD)
MSKLVRQVPAVLILLALAVFAGGFSTNASASVSVVVGACKTLPRYNIIQDAINSVPAGGTIFICPGTYFEQLTINKNLNLTGVASGTLDAPIIVPNGSLQANATSLSSGDPIAAHVWVMGAAVNITNVIVDSTGNGLAGCAAPELVGILYQNATGTLNHVVARNQWIGSSETDPDSNGCQNGLGIFVQSGNGGTSTVTVENSSVHDYQKNGITANEVGTAVTLKTNDVVGQGSTTGAAENGIQIGFGATGTVTGNLVIDNVWAPDTIGDPGDAASGILLFDTSGAPLVNTNTVGNSQFGIAVESDTAAEGDGATVMSNKVFGTRIFDGIDVCSNGNTIESNTIVNSSESAIHLDQSCGEGNNNTVAKNIIIEACTGVLADPLTAGNTVSGSFFVTGQTVGSSCAALTASTMGRSRVTPSAKRNGGKKGTHGAIRP